ncbi:Zinc finger protein Eos [Echinococcus granulosus]|uniref:Zinc finger protein Eos n=1 Tax=Echinococcus granulosus TaxID=6210 RepID=W6UXY2_ECHGR|nr:Zinc finger protein Eos [Echinococcus granulosus]EUB63447.1 Zinc finger protein Eos [Echinococcus granulosus]
MKRVHIGSLSPTLKASHVAIANGDFAELISTDLVEVKSSRRGRRGSQLSSLSSADSMTTLPDVPKSLIETLIKQNFSEMGTNAMHGLAYHNAEVIREMLCMLCGQSAPISQTDKKPTPSHIEAKPINLTRHQSPVYDPDMLYPSPAKGQFICPNCGQDFLNRDALAMHMMESVHSEACATTNTVGNKEDRTQGAIGCHHMKVTTLNHLSPARRYTRLPVPVNNSTVPFHSIFIKTRPLLDTGVSRPGRKPRRLISLAVEEDKCGQLQVAMGQRAPFTLKRPKSCEPKVDSRTLGEVQPDRASSTPGGVQAASSSDYANPCNSGVCALKKTESGLSNSHRSAKALRIEIPEEKRVRTANAEEGDMMMTGRGGSKGLANSVEYEETVDGTGAPGRSCQWQALEPDELGLPVHYPFVCRHCTIGFSDQTLFNLHMGLHTSFNPWRCNMCSKEFSNVYEFTAHALHY